MTWGDLLMCVLLVTMVFASVIAWWGTVSVWKVTIGAGILMGILSVVLTVVVLGFLSAVFGWGILGTSDIPPYPWGSSWAS